MAESPDQREIPPDGIDLDLGEFDLRSVEELEGTVLGQILTELYPEEMADGSLKFSLRLSRDPSVLEVGENERCSGHVANS